MPNFRTSEELISAAQKAKGDLDKAQTREDIILALKKNAMIIGWKACGRILTGQNPEDAVRKWATRLAPSSFQSTSPHTVLSPLLRGERGTEEITPLTPSPSVEGEGRGEGGSETGARHDVESGKESEICSHCGDPVVPFKCNFTLPPDSVVPGTDGRVAVRRTCKEQGTTHECQECHVETVHGIIVADHSAFLGYSKAGAGYGDATHGAWDNAVRLLEDGPPDQDLKQ